MNYLSNLFKKQTSENENTEQNVDKIKLKADNLRRDELIADDSLFYYKLEKMSRMDRLAEMRITQPELLNSRLGQKAFYTVTCDNCTIGYFSTVNKAIKFRSYLLKKCPQLYEKCELIAGGSQYIDYVDYPISRCGEKNCLPNAIYYDDEDENEEIIEVC